MTRTANQKTTLSESMKALFELQLVRAEHPEAASLFYRKPRPLYRTAKNGKRRLTGFRLTRPTHCRA